jgi:hypothetical protein
VATPSTPHGKDKKDEDEELPENFWLYFVFYMVFTLASTVTLIIVVFMLRKKIQTKITGYLNEVNKKKYNARGLHWNCVMQNKLQYLQLIF